MRYDNLLQRLEKARATYEQAVRGILEDARKQDSAVDAAITAVPKKKKIYKKRRKLSAKGRAALIANLAKARAAKRANAKA